MTISANGPIAGTDGPNGGLGLTDTGSFYYREIDQDQQDRIRAAGRTFATLTGGAPCLLLMGQPPMPLPRRRNGVKMAGGTARDVVLPVVAVEAAVSA
jgi:hypothetical protein